LARIPTTPKPSHRPTIWALGFPFAISNTGVARPPTRRPRRAAPYVAFDRSISDGPGNLALITLYPNTDWIGRPSSFLFFFVSASGPAAPCADGPPPAGAGRHPGQRARQPEWLGAWVAGAWASKPGGSPFWPMCPKGEGPIRKNVRSPITYTRYCTGRRAPGAVATPPRRRRASPGNQNSFFFSLEDKEKRLSKFLFISLSKFLFLNVSPFAPWPFRWSSTPVSAPEGLPVVRTPGRHFWFIGRQFFC